MAPHKSRPRPQAHPQPSDYETDAPPPALDMPLPPPRTNEEQNLMVLRRHYPDITALEHVAPYAALYNYNLETELWEKVGTEGTLFLCRLAPSSTSAERYCAVILNRRGLENFYFELTSSENLEFTDPYVILQGAQVFGLWIFADPPPMSTANCRIETANKMMELAAKARASRETETKGSNGASHIQEPVDATSLPMGRQLSLRELFGQQREQDAGFSAYSHNSHSAPSQSQQPSGYATGPTQQDILGQLFMKAKQDYNGPG